VREVPARRPDAGVIHRLFWTKPKPTQCTKIFVTPREQLVRHHAGVIKKGVIKKGVIKKAAAPPQSPHPTSAPYRLPA
jgi:hypothetical protein